MKKTLLAGIYISLLLFTTQCSSTLDAQANSSDEAVENFSYNSNHPSSETDENSSVYNQVSSPEQESSSEFITDYDPAPVTIEADNEKLQYRGRFDFSNAKEPSFVWSGSSIAFKFAGKDLVLSLKKEGAPAEGQCNDNYYSVFLNGKETPHVFKISSKEEYAIPGTSTDKPYSVVLFKRTEAECGATTFLGATYTGAPELLNPPKQPNRKMWFIGNSITCGYGIESTGGFTADTENNYLAFGAVTARTLNAQYLVTAWSGKGIWANYGGGSEKTLAKIYNTINPITKAPANLSKYQANVVVINLGTNDFMSGTTPSEQEFTTPYLQMIREINESSSETQFFLITGPMMLEPNVSKLKGWLDTMKETLKNGDIIAHTFSLTPQNAETIGVGGDWHPNIKQAALNAEELSEAIADAMKWESEDPTSTPEGSGELITENDIKYVTTEHYSLKLNMNYFNDSALRPTVMYIHGGGWQEYSITKDSRQDELQQFIDQGWNAVTIDYRMVTTEWGGVSLDMLVEDCRQALSWIYKHSEKYHVDTDKIVIAGESAGAHLALMAGLITDDDPFENSGYPKVHSSMKVAAILNLFGITDVNPYLEYNVEQYPPGHPWHASIDDTQDKILGLGKSDTEQRANGDICSPVTYVNKNNPPVYTLHGTDDDIVPYTEAENLHSLLDSAEVTNTLISMSGTGHTLDSYSRFDAIFEWLTKQGI